MRDVSRFLKRRCGEPNRLNNFWTADHFLEIREFHDRCLCLGTLGWKFFLHGELGSRCAEAAAPQ